MCYKSYLCENPECRFCGNSVITETQMCISCRYPMKENVYNTITGNDPTEPMPGPWAVTTGEAGDYYREQEDVDRMFLALRKKCSEIGALYLGDKLMEIHRTMLDIMFTKAGLGD